MKGYGPRDAVKVSLGPLPFVIMRFSRALSAVKTNRLLFVCSVIILLYFLFGILRLFPIFQMFRLSFYNFDLIGLKREFIGLRNYIDLFHDTNFHLALRNTLLVVAISVPATVLLAFVLALFYNTKLRLRSFYQLIYFIPAIMPTAAVSLIWRWMYDPGYGLLNYILSWFGIRPVPWLVNERIALFSVILLWVWKWVGYYAILFLVGLQNIPEMYRDAAKVDGASWWQMLRYVTLPLLKPVTLFILIIASTWAFRIFVPVYILTLGSQGAPGNAVRVIVYDMYENFFVFFKVGYASAEGFILFLIVAIFTFLQLKLTRASEMEGGT